MKKIIFRLFQSLSKRSVLNTKPAYRYTNKLAVVPAMTRFVLKQLPCFDLVKIPARTRVLTLISFLTINPAFAATPIDGWYDSVFVGYAYLPNNISQTTGSLTRTGAGYDSGYNAGGTLGFKHNPMRYEGQVTYIDARLKNFDINGVPQTGVTGHDSAILGLANVYYDFSPIVSCVIQPFLGVGIGYAWVYGRFNSGGPSGVTAYSKSNSAFAYQGIGGITYNFAENYALNLEYRYVATSRVSGFGKVFQAHLANVGAIYRFDGNNYR